MSTIDTASPAQGATMSPETGKPFTTMQRVRYSAAYFVFSLFWMVALMIIAAVLLPQRLETIAPQSYTAIYGVLSSVTAIASLVSNLVVGNMSDRTRSIFGKRTPWIASGGLVGGLSYLLMGLIPNAVVIAIFYCLAMVGLNMMIAPVIASLADRLPESMRGTMSAFISAGTLVGSSLGTLIGAVFVTVQLPGWILSAVIMGVSGLVTILIWPKEKSAKDLPKPKADLKSVLASYQPPTKGARDFWLAFVGRTLLIFGYYMILNYQLYILEHYVGQSTKAAAATMSIMSVVLLVVSLIGSLTVGPISDKIGRRKLPVVLASIFLAVGFLLAWLLKSPTGMILFAGIGGFGYSMYGSVDQALNVDVLPNKENAGKDLGILNIATTLGQMVGPIVTSVLVVSFGGYGLVFPIAIIFTVVACVFIMLIRKVK